MHELSSEVLTEETMKQLGNIIKKYVETETSKKLEAFKALNKQAERAGVVFVGDSITEGYPIHELLTESRPLFNRGIAGLHSGQLLQEIDALVLNLFPKKVFLLIGTNDLGDGIRPREIEQNIKQICDKIVANDKKVKIYLLSVYPINSQSEYTSIVGSRNNETIQELNEQLKLKLSSENIIYLDIFTHLVDKNGDLNKDFTTDGLHLTVEGYKIVSKILTPHISGE